MRSANRSFTASDLVQAPRLDADSCCFLGHQIFGATEGVKLTLHVKEALEDLKEAHSALAKSARESSLDATLAEQPDARAAMLALNGFWNSLYAVGFAWTRIEGTAEAKAGEKILAALFPDAVSFMRLAYRQAWNQSHMRLEQIEELELGGVIETLGVTKMLKAIRDGQKACSVALNVTSPADIPTSPPNLRVAIAAFNEALREYVVQVAAMRRRRDPKGTEIALKLLKPIMDIQARPVSRAPNDGAADPPVTTPEKPTPAPTPPAVASSPPSPPAAPEIDASHNGAGATNGAAVANDVTSNGAASNGVPASKPGTSS